MNESIVKAESLHALVVEDESVTRAMMRFFLAAAGVANVTLAENGREALEILQDPQRTIDIVFCDIFMPEMDGIDLIRRAASLKRRPAFVIVSSAHDAFLSTITDLARSRGLNVPEWVVKPISPERVAGIVTEYCGFLANLRVEKAHGFPFSPARSDIEEALERKEILLHYQPIISSRSDTAEAFEALIRWDHHSLGMLWPHAFISEVVETGTIGAMTDRAVQLAFRQCAEWRANGVRTKISLNLSPAILTDRGLPRRLTAFAADAGIDPHEFIFEVTEAAVAGEQIDDVLAVLREIRSGGFSLAIDDYGTSYSDLASIKPMPFNVMKIDRALTMNCVGDEKAREIVGSCIALARGLGLDVVAEGVEDNDEIMLLTEMGVDMLQGFVT